MGYWRRQNVHASKTDTFIIGSSLRVHSYQLQIAKTGTFPAERRGCQPIRWEQCPRHAYVRISYYFLLPKFEIDRGEGGGGGGGQGGGHPTQKGGHPCLVLGNGRFPSIFFVESHWGETLSFLWGGGNPFFFFFFFLFFFFFNIK